MEKRYASSVDVSHSVRPSTCSWKQTRENLQMRQGWPPSISTLRWKGQVPSCHGTVQWISEDHQETRCTGYRHTVENVSKWTEHVNLQLKWGLVVRIVLKLIHNKLLKCGLHKKLINYCIAKTFERENFCEFENRIFCPFAKVFSLEIFPLYSTTLYV